MTFTPEMMAALVGLFTAVAGWLVRHKRVGMGPRVPEPATPEPANPVMSVQAAPPTGLDPRVGNMAQMLIEYLDKVNRKEEEAKVEAMLRVWLKEREVANVPSK